MRLPFTEVGEVFRKLFDTPTHQVHVLIALLEENLSHLGAFTLITHIDHYEFIWLVFESVEFGNDLISADVGGGIVQSLLNVEHLILLLVSHIEQEEFRILSNP